MRRILHDAAAAGDERRTLARIDDGHRGALRLCKERDVLGAIKHHWPLTKCQFFRWIIRGLGLHDTLAAELFEIFPAQESAQHKSGSHAVAAVRRMRLDYLALPF